MDRVRIRKIINEEVKRRVASDAFGEEFEYIIAESPIDEGIVDDILSSDAAGFIADNLPQAGTDALKLWLINNLFDYLKEKGVPIDRRSLFGVILGNVIKSLASKDILEYFKEGGCEKIVDKILKGLQDGITTATVLDKVAEVFFGPGAKLEGVLGSPIRELIQLKLKEMTASLRDPMVDFTCEHRDLEKLKDEIMSGSDSRSSEDSEENDSGSMIKLK